MSEKPDVLVVLKNLLYRLHHEKKSYDYKVVQRAMQEITKLRGTDA